MAPRTQDVSWAFEAGIAAVVSAEALKVGVASCISPSETAAFKDRAQALRARA
jgi:hypothetical protein